MSAADNHWRIYRNLLVGWRATVPLGGDLLAWTVEIIDAAERLEVLRFRKEDGTYWQRDELVAWLERRRADTGVVDAFEFAHRFDRVGSKLAYFSDAGVAEELVDDAGRLLERLRPDAAEYTYTDRRWPPLFVKGHAIEAGSPLPSTSVQVSFQTDIWLPWVPGEIDPAERETFFDNRPLAARHGARLNEFLAALRESALARGGGWELVAYSERPWLPLLVDDAGIRLDAAAPPMSLER